MIQPCSLPAKKRSRVRMIGAEGDSGITWDPAEGRSKARARAYVASHTASLYLAFQDENGVGLHIPHGDFDPDVHDNVVLVPIAVPG